MMENDWLNSLRKRMDDYEESTPDGLWESIESSVFQPHKLRRTVISPWVWRSAAAAAAVTLGVFAGVRLSKTSDSPMLAVNDSAIQQEGQASPRINPSSVNTLGSLTASVDVPETPRVEIVSRSRKSEIFAKAEVIAQETSKNGGEAAVALKEPTVEKYHSPKRIDSEEEKQPDFKTDGDGEDWSGHLSATDERKRNRYAARPGINVSLAGAGNGSQGQKSFNARQFYRGLAYSAGSGAGDGSDLGGSGDDSSEEDDYVLAAPLSPVLASADVTNVTNHKRPLRTGVSFRLSLGGTFGIETGVTYSRLSSTFSTVSETTVNEDEQTLQYLGVPLNITADVVNLKWMSFYLSGGGMVEKCVSGKVRSSVSVSGERSGDVTVDKFKVKPLLWSFNAAAGVQLNLLGNVGIYAEPGLSYHFDDGTKVQTIYKNRPLDFVLTCGLRVSFK